MDKEKIIKDVKLLVDKYQQILDSGASKEYNEEDTKKDFILPLFEALGWEVTNKIEVAAEKKVSKGRVDYAFRLANIPKFFLEAKSLKENIDDRKWIDQAINYAWLKGVTWAVLTNFKKIKVFNSEVKGSTPALSQFFEIEYQDLIKHFDKLYLLSRESLDQGLLDQKALEWGKKLPKKPLDERLSADLMYARQILFENINKNNKSKGLTNEQIEEAIQRILSRLIFIRTLEDREYEEKMLLPIIREDSSKNVYLRVKEVYNNLNEVYDAKLFEHHLCDDLEIDDWQLRTIIENLYKSEEQLQNYDFEIIDADILGGIYEQYLSFILKSAKKGEKFTDKSKKKEEEAIYYTPKHVVDFIVRSIFGELEKNKIDFNKITIIDIASGSGSFLIKAYDYLLKEKIKLKPSTHESELHDTELITYEEKICIIQNNIFGVDIDPMAVEISQLNLYLKGAEKHKRLPIIRDKIRCGNSIIDDKTVHFRGFDWDEEFPNILKENKGFDIIVGNPPYDVLLPSERDVHFAKELEFLRNNKLYAPALGGRTNLFRYMMVRALTLLRKDGYLGYIVPLALINDESSSDLRKFIIDNFQIISIDCFPQKDDPNNRIFREAKLSTCIIIIKNSKPNENFTIRIYPGKDFTETRKEYTISADEIKQFDPISYSIPMVSEKEWQVLKKLHLMDNFTVFNEIADAYQGEMNVTNYKEFFTEDPSNLEMLKGVEIGRYRINKYIRQGKKEWFSRKAFEDMKTTFKRIDHINQERIATQQITGVDDSWRLKAAIIKPGTILANTTNYLLVKKGVDSRLICGILNSKLLDWRFRRTSTNNHVNTYEINSLPVPKRFDEINTKKIIELVERMIDVNVRLVDLGEIESDEKHNLESDISKIDLEINDYVYALYGITDDEKKIIEGNVMLTPLT